MYGYTVIRSLSHGGGMLCFGLRPKRDLFGFVIMRPVKLLRTAIWCLLIGCILAGCIFKLPKGREPDEFKELSNLIDSLYGSNSDVVVDVVGQPAWFKKIGATTFFIYVWAHTNYQMIIVPPVFDALPYTRDWYCVLLEFDEDGKLISHDIQTTTTTVASTNECLNVFPSLNAALAPSQLIKDAGIYCPNADLGHSDAQYHIGNLYYDNPNFKPNIVKAYVWYSLATSGGHEMAAIKLQKVISELSTDQLSTARHFLDIWKPGECQRNLIKASHNASKLH